MSQINKIVKRNNFQFRLYNIVEKKMYYDVMIGNCNGENVCPIIFENENWLLIDGATSIIMQYTGFKDKNNVKIYEGDTIKLSKDLTGIVQYSEKSARFEVRYNETTSNQVTPLSDWIENYEVIDSFPKEYFDCVNDKIDKLSDNDFIKVIED